MGTGEEELARTSGCAGCTNLIVTTGVWKDAYHNPKPPFPFMARTIRGEWGGGGVQGSDLFKIKIVNHPLSAYNATLGASVFLW
jgi:hypothetical protein